MKMNLYKKCTADIADSNTKGEEKYLPTSILIVIMTKRQNEATKEEGPRNDRTKRPEKKLNEPRKNSARVNHSPNKKKNSWAWLRKDPVLTKALWVEP
jgi:hypothetical protein